MRSSPRRSQRTSKPPDRLADYITEGLLGPSQRGLDLGPSQLSGPQVLQDTGVQTGVEGGGHDDSVSDEGVLVEGGGHDDSVSDEGYQNVEVDENIGVGGLQGVIAGVRDGEYEGRVERLFGDGGAQDVTGEEDHGVGGGEHQVELEVENTQPSRQGAGERGELADRVAPVVPPPLTGPVTIDGDGWNLIDRVGGWNAILCQFPMMQEVARQYREIWSWAWGEVLRRIQSAEGERELDRALMWLLFLPQALLRQPKRGGKSGRGIINQRFNVLATEKDWGKLVCMWEEAGRLAEEEKVRRNRQKGANGKERSQEEELDIKRRQVLSLFSKGQVSRGVGRINSLGVADINDQAVRDQLSAKYPARGRELPDTVMKGSPVPNLKGLRDALLRLDKGVSPGTGGLRPEFLITLAEVMDGDKMSLLEEFCMRYLQGELSSWFYAVFPTSQTVPLHKNSDKEIRPIGVKNPLLRTVHREVITANKQELVKYLEPQQLVLSEAGAAKLVNSVRMMLEANPEFIAVKIDMKNAFNSCHRAALLLELENEPTLQHLAWHAATSLAPHSGLEGGGRKWGESGEGFTQGDPESGVWFCIPMHPYVRRMDAALAAGGGLAKFGMDDGYGVGPPGIVFPALAEFEKDVQEHCGLELQRTKCEVFNWQGVLPPGSLPGLTLAGAEVSGRFEPGMVVYGVPVGTNAYVKGMMDIKIEEVARKAAKACEVLGDEKQALWTTLRLSIQQQLDYWLMLVHPSQMERAAARMDEVLWDVLEKVIGAHIPRPRGKRSLSAVGISDGRRSTD